jgi:DNA-binding NtrC family response regulator
VLEDGVVRPVGSDRSTRVDVRVIAASNADLLGGVKKGGFREDLYYRLNVLPIAIPPLREHRSDIPLLVEYFLGRMRDRRPSQTWSVTQEAMVHLWSYDWPGNVRELENMVERLVVLSDNSVIDVGILPAHLANGSRPAEPRIAPALGEDGVDLNALVRELEGRLINEALKRSGGNKQGAARLLGLKRTTFAAKLRRCGVVVPASVNEPDEV